MAQSIFPGCFFALIGLAGCCPVQPSRTAIQNLPPPITLEEQTRRILAWQRAMPLVRANSVPLGVRIDYRDDKGQNKSTNAEGTLLIRQHFDEGKPADVLLLGKAFDQPVFEAGRNDKNWWFLIRMDTKTAWVGDATRPITWPATGGRSESILRADLVPDLLGLSALPGVPPLAGAATPWPAAVMRVNDFDGTNDLMILQPAFTLSNTNTFAPASAGRLQISRELIIDRVTGNLREVRLYNPAGVVMVRSDLSDYQPVAYAGDQEKPATVPQFPRRVTVSYPAQHMTIALQFDRVIVPATIPPAAFATPDFEKEQLKVVPAD